MLTEFDILQVIAERRTANQIETKRGATPDEIERSEKRLMLTFPADLVKWLRACNGATTIYGSALGVSSSSAPPEHGSIDQALSFEAHSVWKARGWIPIANDGCGSHYVMVTRGSNLDLPVAFVDLAEEATLDYAVASNLFHFLRGFFLQAVNVEDPLSEPVWPFDREIALENDPGLLSVAVAPLPWEVKETSN